MINLSKLSFTSNIRFVSNNEFNDITKQQERSHSNPGYIGSPWNRVIEGQEGLTDSIQACVAGGLKDSKSNDAVFFHLVPTPNCSGDFDNRFAPDIKDKIKKFTGKITGLLIGGKTAGSGSFSSQFSQILDSKLENFYKDVNA